MDELKKENNTLLLKIDLLNEELGKKVTKNKDATYTTQTTKFTSIEKVLMNIDQYFKVEWKRNNEEKIKLTYQNIGKDILTALKM